MSTVQSMLETHPRPAHVDREVLAACIEACVACAQTCESCADADLAESDVTELRKCIRLDLDCADICIATSRVLTRQTEYDASLARAQVEACRRVCAACAEECEHHAEMHEHCRICAGECRRCESECARLLDVMK
jgi:hypothetical protein